MAIRMIFATWSGGTSRCCWPTWPASWAIGTGPRKPAQETLVRAYFKMDNLKEPAKFFSWLLGIAERVAKGQQRKELIRRRLR
jgi:hypothetical protein